MCAAEHDLALAPPDLAGALERGERAVERLVGQPHLGGELLERAAQFDGAAVGAGVERKIMAQPLARRPDVALREPRAQIHYLAGERGGKILRRLAVLGEGCKHRGLGIEAHHGVAAGDGIKPACLPVPRDISTHRAHQPLHRHGVVQFGDAEQQGIG